MSQASKPLTREIYKLNVTKDKNRPQTGQDHLSTFQSFQSPHDLVEKIDYEYISKNETSQEPLSNFTFCGSLRSFNKTGALNLQPKKMQRVLTLPSPFPSRDGRSEHVQNQE